VVETACQAGGGGEREIERKENDFGCVGWVGSRMSQQDNVVWPKAV
jgi:hypothetical protein